MCVMLLSTFVPSMTSIGCLTFKIRDVSVFSQSEALLCYHSNKCVTESIFLKLDITNYDNGIELSSTDIAKLKKNVKLDSKKPSLSNYTTF